MPSRDYEAGLKALQDLLPPLEDCPHCGGRVSDQAKFDEVKIVESEPLKNADITRMDQTADRLNILSEYQNLSK